MHVTKLAIFFFWLLSSLREENLKYQAVAMDDFYPSHLGLPNYDVIKTLALFLLG